MRAASLLVDATQLSVPRGAQRLSITTLAALGPVLCLYRATEQHPLRGWQRACGVRHFAVIDSDGPSESLQFHDSHGAMCWQLHLLPDSDFLSWDRCARELGQQQVRPECAVPTRRMPTDAIERAIGVPLWHACALQLHRVSLSGRRDQLAASCVCLSPAGRRAAQRMMQRVVPSGLTSADGVTGAALSPDPSPAGGKGTPRNCATLG